MTRKGGKYLVAASLTLILAACGGTPGPESSQDPSRRTKADDDENAGAVAGKPAISQNDPACTSGVAANAAFPDRLGDGFMADCVKWVPLAGPALGAIRQMADNQEINDSDYDGWTTQLYVFEQKYPMVTGFRLYDVERLAPALGIDPAHLGNYQFDFAKDARDVDFQGRLKWAGICHDEELSEPVQAYLHGVLDGQMMVMIQFGEDMTFTGNHQYTIIFSDRHMVYMRHYRYDA